MLFIIGVIYYLHVQHTTARVSVWLLAAQKLELWPKKWHEIGLDRSVFTFVEDCNPFNFFMPDFIMHHCLLTEYAGKPE